MKNQNVGVEMGFAERLICHFQKNGFTDVTEAVFLHFKPLRPTTYEEMAQEFAETEAKGAPFSLKKYFSFRVIESFSEVRGEAEILSNFHSDFGQELRRKFPELFYGKKNYLFDENAAGTKYDLAIRIGRNVDNVARIVLLNDPSASFVEFFERQMNAFDEWETLCNGVQHAVGRVALLNI